MFGLPKSSFGDTVVPNRKAHCHSLKPRGELRTEMNRWGNCGVVGFHVVDRYSDGQSGIYVTPPVHSFPTRFYSTCEDRGPRNTYVPETFSKQRCVKGGAVTFWERSSLWRAKKSHFQPSGEMRMKTSIRFCNNNKRHYCVIWMH